MHTRQILLSLTMSNLRDSLYAYHFLTVPLITRAYNDVEVETHYLMIQITSSKTLRMSKLLS